MKIIRFFQKFIPKSSALLGVNVDYDSFKFVALKKIDERYLLSSCQKIFFPKKKGNSEFFLEDIKFLNFLKEKIQHANFSTSQAVLALPFDLVLFRTIELDKTLTDSEVNIQLQAQAERYFNHPSTELMMDFEWLNSSKNHPKLREVRWAAVRKSEINPYLTAFFSAGLSIEAVEVDLFSLERAALFFLKRKKWQTLRVAVVQINFSSIRLLVFYQGQSTYTDLESYRVSIDEAQSSIIFNTIVRILENFFNESANNKISMIFLSGQYVTLDLLEDIQIHTKIKTQCLDIFSVLEKYDHDDNNQSHEFLISVGASMRPML